ncbi:DNA-directed RNA polymerase III subunit RPC17 [Sporobolomyces salmoneus]|uniref:DNA-directed RNA polymerase III subunit RPC17 n=1 Tax=Sporobolomyces salmoneus TaxID=183962 RepID=UPI0031722060
METLNERAGFLSNFEVLQLLRAQRSSTASKMKQLEERKDANKAAGIGDSLDFTEKDRIKPQDLQTVTFEAIKYLEEPVHPTIRQTEESVVKLLDKLETDPRYTQLTKSERLQLVNSAPTSLVELHVCIEDLTERYPEESEQLEVIDLIRSHLENSQSSAAPTVTNEDIDQLHDEQEQREDERAGGDEVYEDDGFVNEGGRKGDGEERDLDEDVEEI